MTLRSCILLLAAGLALMGCTRQSAVPVDMADIRVEASPDQESWDFDMLISEDGRARLRLLAPYMSYYDRKDSTYMLLTGLGESPGRRVYVTVYGSEGDTTATVEADRMMWFDRERRMEARGNVIVHAENGRSLESEHLRWLEAEHSISTDGFARITLEDGLLEGYGLKAKENLEEVRLTNVTGNFTVEDP